MVLNINNLLMVFQDYSRLARVESAGSKVLMWPPAAGEPASPLGPTCTEEKREFGRRVSQCVCASRDRCNSATGVQGAREWTVTMAACLLVSTIW